MELARPASQAVSCRIIAARRSTTGRQRKPVVTNQDPSRSSKPVPPLACPGRRRRLRSGGGRKDHHPQGQPEILARKAPSLVAERGIAGGLLQRCCRQPFLPHPCSTPVQRGTCRLRKMIDRAMRLPRVSPCSPSFTGRGRRGGGDTTAVFL